MKLPGLRGGIEEVWYGTSPAASAWQAALRPAAAVFGLAVRVRGGLYDAGFLAARRAPAPVVSVGALRVGGSGKTPLVLWLARSLVAAGLRPCVVTRGYGAARSNGAPFLLTGQGALADGALERCGDEALLLALRSGCPVAVGADRRQACELAAREAPGRVDLFLLDDGFQHRRLARDLDIVLVDGHEEGEALLPAGPLRERLSALARADVVVTVGSAAAALPAPASALRLRARTLAKCLVKNVTDDSGDALAVLAGRRVAAVAAIARPERFLAELEAAGAVVVGSILRRDHHRYDDGDRCEIEAAARGADFVVTTEKDLVKLPNAAEFGTWRALRVEVELDEAGLLLERLRALVSFDR